MPKYPEPQPGVLSIAPYVQGKSSAGTVDVVAKLSANESPLGASPKAVAALQSLDTMLSDYPEGRSTDLRAALADQHGLIADQIVIGSGSDELLHLIAQTYLGEGDEAVISEFGFLVYPIVTKGAGATPVFAKDKDYRVDVDAMLAAVSDKTKVMFLANPNNPTGTFLDEAALRRLHAGLPEDVLLVIDSAYAEYATDEAYVTGASLAAEFDNVVMVRTFSKIGLAALRLGWMLGPPHIIDVINRLRGPFNVNMAAQLAGKAALEDVDFTKKLIAHNLKWRTYLEENLPSNHVRIISSQANFVMALFPESGDVTAKTVNQALLAKGVIVRELTSYGLPNALRISIGTEDAMRAVVAIIRDVEHHD